MSATLRISDFAENQTLFDVPPPIIEIPARQHPVTVHFNRKTQPDYIDQAIRKTIKIHSRLPPGGILIFLTGQNEITGVCKRLEMRFGRKAIEEKRRMRQAVADGMAKKPRVFPEDDLQEIKPKHVGGRERRSTVALR
jgi:ATP-dependent RNA helicase DHX37/DHR1